MMATVGAGPGCGISPSAGPSTSSGSTTLNLQQFPLRDGVRLFYTCSSNTMYCSSFQVHIVSWLVVVMAHYLKLRALLTSACYYQTSPKEPKVKNTRTFEMQVVSQ